MGYKESLNDFINSQEWISAKTMANVALPHWFCMKALCDSEGAWDWFIRFIDMYGVQGTFCGKTCKYLYWGDYRYWMDAALEEYDFINRCVIPDGERKPENFPSILNA